jgi:hypothetical protein
MKKCIAEMDVHSPDHDERKHPNSRWLQPTSNYIHILT